MERRNRSFWAVVVLGAFATLMALFGGGSAFARGGRGGFGGGRGGRGGGASARAARAASRGGNRRNSERKEEQARQRREERLARVAEARIIYAKRERQDAWDKETSERFKGDVKNALKGATE